MAVEIDGANNKVKTVTLAFTDGDTALTIADGGGTTVNTSLDMNGTELILDADADTSITADTDDQIDVRIAGADDFKITANTFEALSGSEIKTNTINETTGGSGVTIDSLVIKDQKITNMVGMVAQVVSVSKTSSFNTNSTSYTDITGFTASITPSSSSSKILVISNWMWGSSASPYPDFILLRGSTSINIGDSDTGATQVSVGNNTDPAGDEGNIQQEQLSHHFLDSPSSTSEVTYKWQTRTFNSGRVIYVGRTADVSDGNRATAPTNITLMEILQ